MVLFTACVSVYHPSEVPMDVRREHWMRQKGGDK